MGWRGGEDGPLGERAGGLFLFLGPVDLSKVAPKSVQLKSHQLDIVVGVFIRGAHPSPTMNPLLEHRCHGVESFDSAQNIRLQVFGWNRGF